MIKAFLKQKFSLEKKYFHNSTRNKNSVNTRKISYASSLCVLKLHLKLSEFKLYTIPTSSRSRIFFDLKIN